MQQRIIDLINKFAVLYQTIVEMESLFLRHQGINQIQQLIISCQTHRIIQSVAPAAGHHKMQVVHLRLGMNRARSFQQAA